MLKKLFYALAALSALALAVWAVCAYNADTMTATRCILTVGCASVLEYVALKNI